MIAFVGHQLGGRLGARCRLNRREVPGGARQRARQGRGVAPVGRMHLGRDHRAGIEIDRVLGLVGQMRAAVLQLGDPRVRIGRALPLRVGQLLAFAVAIQPDQVLGRRRLDAALLGHPRQHLAVALAGVAPDDRPQRRVGLHGRGIDADPLALDQAVLGQSLQHPGEDLVVDLERQAGAGAAQPGVVRHRLPLAEPQELPQRQAVGAAPLQAALAVDAFEVADQQHAEVAARRQRWPAAARGVVRRALPLDEAVEPGRDQLRLQPVVERVARRARHLRPRHQHLRLTIPLPTQSHPNPPHPRRRRINPGRFRQRAAYRLFCDAEAQAYLQAHCRPEVLSAYRRSRQPAQKADLFRLAWLQAEGGWYADADDRCLAPLERVAPAMASLVLYQEQYGTLGNNFIGAARHEPVIARALAQGVEAIQRGNSDIVWFATGPGLLTRAFVQDLAASPLQPASWLGGRVVLDRSVLFRTVPAAPTTSRRPGRGCGPPSNSGGMHAPERHPGAGPGSRFSEPVRRPT